MNKLETYSLRELLFPEEDVRIGDQVAFYFGNNGYRIDGIVESVSPGGIFYLSVITDWNLRNPKSENVKIVPKIIEKENLWGAIFLNPAEKSIVAGHSAYYRLSREGALSQIPLDSFYPKR